MNRKDLISIVKSKATLVVEMYEVSEVIFYVFCPIIECFNEFKYEKKIRNIQSCKRTPNIISTSENINLSVKSGPKFEDKKMDLKMKMMKKNMEGNSLGRRICACHI